MADDYPDCSLSNRNRFRRNAWALIAAGLIAFWGGVLLWVFG